jgi:predicted nucleotidyltransferase
MTEELVTQLIDILKSWAKKQTTKEFIGFYLFGSLINENGNQFLRDSSDIDLIIILQNSGILNRARVCHKLQKTKLELELLLLPIKNKVMRVRFRGRRQAYVNQEPSIIKFEGSCTLGE